MTVVVALAGLIVLGEWTGIARALFDSPIYAAALDLGLAMLFAVSAFRAARLRRWPRLHVLDVLVVAYFLLALVQTLNPNVPSLLVGLEGFRKTAFTMLGYGIVRLWTPDATMFLRIVALGSIPAFLWAARQFFVPLPAEFEIISSAGTSEISFRSGAMLRAFAPTAGPFHLGVLAGTILVISIVFAAFRSRRWVALSLLAAVCLGLSITRANIGAAVLAVGVMAAFAFPVQRKVGIALLGAPGIAATVVAVLFATSSLATTQTVPSLQDGNGGPSGSPPAATQNVPNTPPARPTASSRGVTIPDIRNPLEDRSLQFRFSFWAEQFAAVAERPLLGYGTSAAADGFDRLYAGTTGRVFNPHSIYMKPALELGLVGLALFLAILLAAAVTTVRVLRIDQTLGLVAGGVLVLLVVAGATGPMLDAYPFNLAVWAIFGFVVGARTEGLAQGPHLERAA